MLPPPPPFGQDPRDRVDRTYFPNGQLQKEIHYRGITEHGRYRSWYPDGTMAEEYWFEVGAYVNGVNRTWHPNGQLHTEHEYVNRRAGRMRVFDADGKEVRHDPPFFKKKFRKRKVRPSWPMPDAAKMESHNAFIAERLNSNKAEALAWLRAGPKDSRNLGEFCPHDSIELVEILYRLGAVEVLAIEIEEIPGRDEQTSNYLVVRLPTDAASRDQLFDFIDRQSDSQGFDGEPDWGQEHRFMMLC